ncbi:1-propanol dehydrogenase PduQ [Enterococcus wangshanyuanii]|uniref:Alcohol dehydrogenase n=1 Tax=Enterococcus wangshanyuanii TaxID=2005703 RepID=A0ABQ1NFZ4_9ENTE|nr:1-propanol dehydrogenase PduQ [Enterococcus wangshanyuanii]GGC75219.1 alcohol dehydrogenase [Enterococcus wangshanyuanii]
MFNQFKMPTQIITGAGSLAELQGLSLKQVLIICDPFMEQNGTVETIGQLLKEKKIGYSIFSEIIPDPTIDVVTKGLIAAIKSKPDGIIALGGGSAMDAAKVIRQIYTTAEKETSVQLICIPTTSGTGSEVTAFAVISDPIVQSKYALVDDQMLPDYAILDPLLTMSVPKNVTADTGIDVFTHCMEALASTNATDFTDACAEKAMKIIWNDLVSVFNDGENSMLREKIHNASCLAGIAFSEASLGICHSLAHALGGRFHIPHGRANAMLLPHVISYNAGLEIEKEIPQLLRYKNIAELLGFKAGTSKATVHGMITGIQRQFKQMDIPKTINECGIDPEEFVAAIPEMAEKALEDKCTLTNPRTPKKAELESIYQRLLRGGY